MPLRLASCQLIPPIARMTTTLLLLLSLAVPLLAEARLVQDQLGRAINVPEQPARLVTLAASLNRSVLQAGRGLWPDPWFVATLADAYIGFVIFYVWVAYKERTVPARILWFLFIMGLGNLAAAFYVLLQLRKLGPGESWEKLLLRKRD